MGKIATVHAESHRMEKNDEKYPGHYISIGLPTLLIPQALLVKVFITDEECLVKTFAFVNAPLLAMSGHLMQISKPQKAKKKYIKIYISSNRIAVEVTIVNKYNTAELQLWLKPKRSSQFP